MAELAHAYRGILRELRKSAVAPRKTNQAVATSFRSIANQYQTSGDATVLQDLRNALLFLKSQREHKILLDRYNPLFDLTAEERIKATARRVGLDMPVVHKAESS
ncbi:hypothetical protein DXG03_002929 [Asterophora parasitica]|uniref:Complex 1 LYR protein n=1 Tax=Asterophora parasitica TaxID=117018 RepID=A0A9P7GC61_9AGAR|nr:hypothetical protein DXG03_002929 [Asterophora parasitica]